MDSRYIFIDLETTGLGANSDRICQIGMILNDGSEFESLINPEIPIPASVTAVHGITDEKVKDAPTLSDLAPFIIDALKNANVFVAYNFLFDFQVLQNELFRTSHYVIDEADYIFIDPYRIFRKMHPHTLSNAYKFYVGQELEGAHSAIHDIRAAKAVLEKQKELYSELFSKTTKEIADFTVGDTSIIGKWFEKTPEGKIIYKQGKYKNATVTPEHKDYLKWIYGLNDNTFSERRFISSVLKIH
jgi:DNA polymerase-3 subunit epsilon